MSTDIIEPGQSDDAETTLGVELERDGQTYIDDGDSPLNWSDGSELDDDSLDDEWQEQDINADDEDWEMADGDFTKQYNRLKQHVAIRSGQNDKAHTMRSQSSKLAPLPAMNQPRTLKATVGGTKPIDGQQARLLRYSSRIADISQPYSLDHGMGGVSVNRKAASERANIKGKSDRATNEQVLDPRTRLILFKMIGRGLIFEVNGCISTGKEANVYHAFTPTKSHLALKIYKTSILIFKDRDRYVTGEHRFRHGYSRHNPRKMVRLWAEKEMRNLKRLAAAGIPCPDVMEVRENVLVMSFLGDDEGWASPRLKDAEILAEKTVDLYKELLVAMHKMYNTCRLIHADLSEYNIMYHNSHLYIIDVSQSVEHDHPAAFDFLRADIKNADEFWARRGVKTLGLRRTFDFVTDSKNASGTDDELEAHITALLEQVDLERGDADEDEFEPSTATAETNGGVADSQRPDDYDREQDDAVFLKSFIPRNLNEVHDPERDAAKLKRGEGDDLIYARHTGIAELASTLPTLSVSDSSAVKVNGHNDEEEGETEDSGTEEEGDSKDPSFGARQPRGHRHEDKDAKKERKKLVKDEAREKRKAKMPKAEKKRKIKVTSSKH